MDRNKKFKGVQRHLGSEKGMLCDAGLPHSVLEEWKTDGKYVPKHGPSMVLRETEENPASVWGVQWALPSDPWSMTHFLPWPSPKAEGRGSSSHPSLMHKDSSWNETESPLYQSGLPQRTWLSPAVPSSHLARRSSRSVPAPPTPRASERHRK